MTCSAKINRHKYTFQSSQRHFAVDFLAVYGLKTSGGKAELVAPAFLTVKVKLPTIKSSEKQQAKLKKYYAGRLKRYSICNPLSAEKAK